MKTKISLARSVERWGATKDAIRKEAEKAKKEKEKAKATKP